MNLAQLNSKLEVISRDVGEIKVRSASIETKVDHLGDQHRGLDVTVNGNDKDPGLVVKVDRLEQSAAYRKGWITLVGAAIATAIVGGIASGWVFAERDRPESVQEAQEVQE